MYMYWPPVRSETGFVMLGKFWYRSHLFKIVMFQTYKQ